MGYRSRGWCVFRGHPVLMIDTVAHAFVGAGIVAASETHAEWEETDWKLRMASEALQLRSS